MTTESSVDTASKLRDALRAMFAPDMAATPIGIVDGAFKIQFRAAQPQDANIYLAGANLLAGDCNTIAGNVAHTHTLSDSTPIQMKITSFKITATAAVTVAATHYATVQLVYNNGNGGSDTVIATGNTVSGGGIGNLTANTPAAFTITAANAVVPSGSCLQVKVTKSGSAGKELPSLTFTTMASIGTVA